MRRLLCILVLLGCGTVWAAACERQDDTIVLTIQDFGTAYFRDFTLNPGRNAAQFRNGVCLHAPDESWVVTALSIDVTGLQPGMPISVSASAATLTIPQWEMTARELTSDGREFVIHGGTFRSDGLTGSVERVSFDLETGVIDGEQVQAEGPGYRLSGSHALFRDDQLTLQQASVTTCKCPGEPAYLLVGDEATVSLLADGEVTLRGGELQLGWLRLQLEEVFSVTNEALTGLSPPLVVDWNPAQPGQDPRGRGLSVTVPPFNLHEDVTMEFGLLGLDRSHPLSGYLLLNAATDEADLTVGYMREGGPRADFAVREQLSSHLLLTVGMDNRHYPQQAYLHQGYLTLATTFPVQNLAGRASVAFGGSMTAAVSSQIRSGNMVLSPRLRTALYADWRLPDHPAGLFRLRSDVEVSVYSEDRSQYGLRFRPSWSRSFGPVAVSVAHDLQLTDSGSPFTAAVDLLTPISRTTASARITDLPVEADRLFSVAVTLEHNWLRFSDGSRRGFEDLSLSSSLKVSSGDWLVTPHLQLQLAGLLDPRSVSDRLAFVEAGMTAVSGDVELGVRGRWHFAGRLDGLELLELSAAVPIQVDNVKLVPFLAVDFSPLVTLGTAPGFSGHGVVVEWDSCCGLFEFGYRVHGSEFTTVLSAEFIH